MTRESTLILLKCKLYSLRGGLQRAINKGCDQDIIQRWEDEYVKTQQQIFNMIR